jgi:hypothetical protein
VKFLRTIRFDASDDHVFDRAAEPGEWAVSGAFEFAVARELDDDGIHEAFREIAAARADDHARVWEIVDDA